MKVEILTNVTSVLLKADLIAMATHSCIKFKIANHT